MKVSRHEYQEITSEPMADWLNDHMVDKFLKEASGVDYLKQYLDKLQNNKFSSIEEKMADIRERIGFDVSNRLREEVEKIEKAASACSSEACACNGKCKPKPQTKTARQQTSEDMKEILNFIVDMTQDKPDCIVAEVMDKLSETSKYNGIKSQIDDEKLRRFVQDQISQNSERRKTDDPLHYVADDGDVGDEYSAESNANEMWNHAQVGDII